MRKFVFIFIIINRLIRIDETELEIVEGYTLWRMLDEAVIGRPSLSSQKVRGGLGLPLALHGRVTVDPIIDITIGELSVTLGRDSIPQLLPLALLSSEK